MTSELTSMNEDFYQDIKAVLDNARKTVHQTVNTAMVQTYWYIGQKIVEEEQNGNAKAQYGSYLVKTLTQRLTSDFGSGFSQRNIKYFRQFYLAFPDLQIGHTVSAQLSWTIRVIIMVKNKINVSVESTTLEAEIEKNLVGIGYEMD